MADREYWDPNIETMPLDKLRALQLRRFQEIAAYAYEKTLLYLRKMDAAGVRPQGISRLEDIALLPLTD